jgi:hypothetical protein
MMMGWPRTGRFEDEFDEVGANVALMLYMWCPEKEYSC